MDLPIPTPPERTAPAAVACNGCTLCCTSGEFILVTVEDGDYPYDTQAVDLGDGRYVKALAHRPDGSCVYATPTGCRIHGHAPITCQVFDCAALYASKTRRQRRITASGSAYAKALYAQGRRLHRLRIGLGGVG